MIATDTTLPDLRRRIELLRDEIAMAENKIPRMHEAVRTRKQTLSRLEAKLALEELRPPHSADER
jgi:hypothetical protein